MPESVRDRPTNAYEMIFLLAKQGRYFYDAEAVREPEEYGGKDTARLSKMNGQPSGRTFLLSGVGCRGQWIAVLQRNSLQRGSATAVNAR